MSKEHSGQKAPANRRFAVSTHRGGARHQVRYVESGGGSDDSGECRLCQPVIESREDGKADNDKD